MRASRLRISAIHKYDFLKCDAVHSAMLFNLGKLEDSSPKHKRVPDDYKSKKDRGNISRASFTGPGGGQGVIDLSVVSREDFCLELPTGFVT
jgi:hypothetical protein